MSSGAAVNVPTNYKLKESDVNKKLQLYGIYAGELKSRSRTWLHCDGRSLSSVLVSAATCTQEHQHAKNALLM